MKKIIQTPAFIVNGKKWIPVALYDKLTIETANERKIQLRKTKGYKIPTNDQNPVFKAASALQQLKPNKFGVTIRIEKNIPTDSGLHSQLSNAAGVLIALNRLWKFNFSNPELLAIAKKIDPLMTTVLKLFFKPPTVSKKAVLIRPKHIMIDSKWAKENDPLKHFPDLKDFIGILKKAGAEKGGLSGPGPMVFGWFDKLPDLPIPKEKTDFVWTGNTCNKGAELIN